MKKYLIILMFAVITPATQSCQVLANVLNWQYGNIYYVFPRNNTWNWFNPIGNNQWNGNHIWVDFSQSSIPRNWLGRLFFPAPDGYIPIGNPTCSYRNGRYFMDIPCQQNRNLSFEFSNPSLNRIKLH